MFNGRFSKHHNTLNNVQDLRLHYVVSIDFWQYKVEVENEIFPECTITQIQFRNVQ